MVRVALKCISFDLWGTLVHETESNSVYYTNLRIDAIYDAIKDRVKVDRSHVKFAFEKIHPYLRMLITNRECVAYVIKALGVESNLDELIDLATMSYVEGTFKFVPRFPEENREVIRSLKEDYKLTLIIITNSSFSAVNIWTFLKNLRLDGYFDAIYSSCEIGYTKPMPFIFEHALRSSGFRPYEVLHVGDRFIEDYLGALNVGMHALLYTGLSKYSDEELRVLRELRVPVISTLSELFKYVK